MLKWTLLMAGGACGTLGRYALSGLVHRLAGTGFPHGTLIVNVIGCALIGFLMTFMEARGALTQEVRLFWTVGLLGAFTTFSTFIYESWRLVEDGQIWLAGTNLIGSLVLGLAALWVGTRLASIL